MASDTKDSRHEISTYVQALGLDLDTKNDWLYFVRDFELPTPVSAYY